MNSHLKAHWGKYTVAILMIVGIAVYCLVSQFPFGIGVEKAMAANAANVKAVTTAACNDALADAQEKADAQAKADAKALADANAAADAQAKAYADSLANEKAKADSLNKALAAGSSTVPNPQANQGFVPPANVAHADGTVKRDTTNRPITFKLKGLGANKGDTSVALVRGQDFSINNLPKDRVKAGKKFISFVTNKEEQMVSIDGHWLPARGLTITDNADGTCNVKFTRGETKTSTPPKVSFTL